MIDKHVVDTHALVWSLAGDKRLGAKAKAVMNDPMSKMVLPVIALAEAIDIVRKGRTKIPDVPTLLSDIFADTRFEIEPLTVDILLDSENALAVPEMHDRLITATALSLEKQGFKVAVLTKDPDITASNLVRNCLKTLKAKRNRTRMTRIWQVFADIYLIDPSLSVKSASSAFYFTHT